MTRTFKQAVEDKNVFFDLLRATFNSAAGSFVKGADVGVDVNDWYMYIRVNLARNPTAKEAALLPQEFRGLAVKYDVVGPIRARI